MVTFLSGLRALVGCDLVAACPWALVVRPEDGGVLGRNLPLCSPPGALGDSVDKQGGTRSGCCMVQNGAEWEHGETAVPW
jgi:hypothetical protein